MGYNLCRYQDEHFKPTLHITSHITSCFSTNTISTQWIFFYQGNFSSFHSFRNILLGKPITIFSSAVTRTTTLFPEVELESVWNSDVVKQNFLHSYIYYSMHTLLTFIRSLERISCVRTDVFLLKHQTGRPLIWCTFFPLWTEYIFSWVVVQRRERKNVCMSGLLSLENDQHNALVKASSLRCLHIIPCEKTRFRWLHSLYEKGGISSSPVLCM